jgi:Protein of unknown function (DUF721).
MGDSRIKDVSSLLAFFFDEEKLKRGERYSDFFQSWTVIVGSRLAAHSRVADVDKGFLIIEAEHPGWIQLLQMKQTSILEEIAQRYPELNLRGIVFRLASKGPVQATQAMTKRHDEGPEEKLDAEAESKNEAASVKDVVEPSVPADPEFQKLMKSLKKTMQGKD